MKQAMIVNVQRSKLRLPSAKRKGSSSVEYAVVLGLICIVSLGTLSVLGVKASSIFGQVQAALEPGREPHTR